MTNQEEFSWINNRVLYTLSFILVLWELRDFIISLFPTDFSISIFYWTITLNEVIGAILLFLLLSLYLYSANYIFKDPMSKFRRNFSIVASFFWITSLSLPILIFLIIFLQGLLSEGDFPSILVVLFILFNFWFLSWSEKNSKKIAGLILDKKLEQVISTHSGKDLTSIFLKEYGVLEILIRRIFLEKMNMDLDYNKSINLQGASNILLSDKLISQETDLKIKNLWERRNQIFHINIPVKEEDIIHLREIIKNISKEVISENTLKVDLGRT